MRYGFIGCGNMGGALARALSNTTKDIQVCDRSGKAAGLASRLGIGYSSAETIAQTCDCIYLGVKPHMMKDVLAPVQGILREKKPLLVTMAAGLTMAQIDAFAGGGARVIRIMPNTPVAVGKGVVLYCANEQVSSEALAAFLADLAPAGQLEALDEKLMDAGSALCGCGPAYAYMFMDAMADGAVACGIPRAMARRLAAATLSGAAEMLLATGQHPGELKDAVCSPGGSTIAGVKALEDRGFRGAVMDCVLAAHKRNGELGK